MFPVVSDLLLTESLTEEIIKEETESDKDSGHGSARSTLNKGII